jgi:hypothetical protein
MSKRLMLLILALLTLAAAACQMIKPVPSPTQRAVMSPLSRAMTSPLPRAVARPFGPLALSSAYSEPVHQVWFPIIMVGQAYPCNMNYQAAALATIFLNDKKQRRIGAYCDERLVKAAQAKAENMAALGFFDHYDKEGHGPNYWIVAFGCALPDYYPKNGNNTESLALNARDAVQAWELFRASPLHWPHVAGLHPFYAAQRAYGIGYAASAWGEIRVLMTAHPCGSKD